MTGWDVVITIINQFPPVIIALLMVTIFVAVVIGITGFSRHGLDFIKHGFQQNHLSELLTKLSTKDDIDGLRSEVRTDINRLETEIGKMETELATIKVNHFGHLKNFLTELTSILLDKNIINNENKARLDNQLRGM